MIDALPIPTTEADPSKMSIIGCLMVWGNTYSGKTIFGLTSPYKPILDIDFHGSAKYYYADRHRLGLDFTHRLCLSNSDVAQALELAKHPPTGFDRWGTIIIDTIDEFTQPLVEHLQRVNVAKLEKQSEMVWGDINHQITDRLRTLMSNCDVLVLTADKRTFRNVDEPKAKPAVVRLTDVVIRLERDPNQKIPAGIVTRGRGLSFPPRIPQFTWESLFYYIKNPVDFDNLADEEKVTAPLYADDLYEEAA